MRRIVPLAVAFALAGCKIEKISSPPGAAFSDDFERATLGDAWYATGGNWRIAGGELVIDHAYNHPLWLRQPIPQDAVIELDCWSNDPAGDLKVEAWGDGKTYATEPNYVATSYVFIFGGWHNQISTIARMHEHGGDRQQRMDRHVERGKKYHWRIARSGGSIDWQIDGKPFLRFDDPAPLHGPDHAYFGFNDWEAELHFDNLKITPGR
jgi:hypothetical protein